jgi:hypothetical protein
MLNEVSGEAIAPAETVAEPGQTAAQPPETATTEAPADQAETKEPDEKRFTQADLDKQIRLRVAREQRKYERRLGELEANVRNGQTPQQPAQPVGRPTLEQFKSYDDFQEALIEWKAEQIVSKRDEQRQRHESVSAQQQRMAELSRKFEAAQDAARDIHEDYDDVVGDIPKGSLPMHVVEAIGESDIGPQLLYRLASDPKLAAEIARLSPVAAARRLTRLEDEIAKPKPQTKAPEPVRPLSGRTADASDMPSEKDSVDEWVRKERARMAKLGLR